MIQLTQILKNRSFYRAVASIACMLLLASCSSTTSNPVISNPLPVVGKQITGDTLHGALSGTVTNIYPTGTPKAGQTHTTWYMDQSVIVPAGDTLLIQQGITIIVLNTGNTAAGSPEFQVQGTMICDGAKGAPIYLTVAPGLRKYNSLTDVNSGALWGGIAGSATSGDVILKWTHLEYCGGSSGSTDPIYGNAGTRYAVWFQNPASNFIMEDSWITGSTDDPLRISGGKVSIFRNVVECAAPTSGDFNMKSGTIGDMAYNVYVGIATNGPKLANTGGINPECNVNIYNNTIVTGGWRCTKSGRAGSIDIEAGARGVIYNNLIVNCRTGFRVLGGSTIADTANSVYDYQWYYGAVDSIVNHFYPSDGIQSKRTNDKAGTAGQYDPKFVNYDVNQIPAATWNTFPMAFSNQLPVENLMRTMDENGNARFVDVPTSFKSNFNLQPTSPCVGKAYTGTVKSATGSTLPIPINACPQYNVTTNKFGAITKGLGADFGAYQSDNSGNQQ